MDFKWLFLGLSIALFSCAELKNSAENAADNAVNIWQGKQTLSVTMQSHRPYCGGAAPTKEQERGFTEALADQVFYIYKDERPKSVKDMVRVKTDENGKSGQREIGAIGSIRGTVSQPERDQTSMESSPK